MHDKPLSTYVNGTWILLKYLEGEIPRTLFLEPLFLMGSANTIESARQG